MLGVEPKVAGERQLFSTAIGMVCMACRAFRFGLAIEITRISIEFGAG